MAKVKNKIRIGQNGKKQELPYIVSGWANWCGYCINTDTDAHRAASFITAKKENNPNAYQPMEKQNVI